MTVKQGVISEQLHAGGHMVGQRVWFRLKDSSLATIFNRARHDEWLSGECSLAYDGLIVVFIDGWRFGHVVRAERATLVEPAAEYPPMPWHEEGDPVRPAVILEVEQEIAGLAGEGMSEVEQLIAERDIWEGLARRLAHDHESV
jgi:hypothetical protein